MLKAPMGYRLQNKLNALIGVISMSINSPFWGMSKAPHGV